MSLTKDAPHCMIIRPGNIMKPVTNFGVSAGPLTPIGDSEMILCPCGDLSWTFLTRLDTFRTCEAERRLLDGTGIKFDLVSGWEAPLQACVRSSIDLVFRDLVYLAMMHGIEGPHSY